MNLSATGLVRACAHPLAVTASLVRARLGAVAIGEACELRPYAGSADSIGRGAVMAVDHDVALVSVIGESARFSPSMVVVPTGNAFTVPMSPSLLGSVLDGNGTPVGRLDENPVDSISGQARALVGAPISFAHRRRIAEPLHTGIRVVDGLLTTGIGQRVGVFAPAGAGKTTFCEMLLAHAKADVYVIALVGERGREVATFVDALRGTPQANRTVLVQSTSDTAPATRCNAAWMATAVAEYFRDRGQRVLLVLDSATRYARALRDMALAAGEPPARRGYPASVFEALPRLMERPGCLAQGSITAFYTVLLEDEDESDVIGEEVKSLLDGHIYLSARLAGRGQFPAVDVLKSSSRLFQQLTDPARQADAAAVRQLMGNLADLQMMRDLGEYRPGENDVADEAVSKEPALQAYLRQGMHERVSAENSQRGLYELAR
jgi:type III secretion protein N (ATPase)